MNYSRLGGILLIIVGAGLWGTLGLFGLALFNSGLTALDVVTVRVVTAWLCFAFWMTVIKHEWPSLRRKDLLLFVLYGVISVALYNFFYFEAISRAGISVAVALLYTAPAWATLLARVFLGERLSFLFLVALAMGVSGVALVAGAVSSQWASIPVTGVWFGLCAGISYALFSIFGKKALDDYNPMTTLFYTFGFGALVLLFWFSIQGGWLRLKSIDVDIWWLLLVLGILPTFLAYLAYTKGLRRIPASLAALLTTVEPIVAVIVAFIWAGERLTDLQTFGIGLVMMSSVIASFRGSARAS